MDELYQKYSGQPQTISTYLQSNWANFWTLYQVSIFITNTNIGADWRINVYIYGIPRCHDFRNFDFIKRSEPNNQEVMKALYDRFGILNLFNPLRPTGMYRLDLAIYEERMVCKMLCDLAR